MITVEQAKRNLRQHGFTPITPAIYAALLADGEFTPDDILTDQECAQCNNKLRADNVGDTCASCQWWDAMSELAREMTDGR